MARLEQLQEAALREAVLDDLERSPWPGKIQRHNLDIIYIYIINKFQGHYRLHPGSYN